MSEARFWRARKSVTRKSRTRGADVERIEGVSKPGARQLQARFGVSVGPLKQDLALTCMPKSGMIMPILGAKAVQPSRRKSLADALFTKTQQRVLGVLFGQPERSFYASELIRDAGTGSGAAQRELAKLEESGLIVGTTDWQSEALPSQRGVTAVFRTAEYRAENSRSRGAAARRPEALIERRFARPSCTVPSPRRPTNRQATST